MPPTVSSHLTPRAHYLDNRPLIRRCQFQAGSGNPALVTHLTRDLLRRYLWGLVQIDLVTFLGQLPKAAVSFWN